jgi:hypothetical protein
LINTNESTDKKTKCRNRDIELLENKKNIDDIENKIN